MSATNFVRPVLFMLFVTGVTAAAAAAWAAGAKVEFPAETGVFKKATGSELAGQCLICHSADYIITQPADKPLAFWKAEVVKMKNVYGAPIADDQIDALSVYFARNYGTEK